MYTLVRFCQHCTDILIQKFSVTGVNFEFLHLLCIFCCCVVSLTLFGISSDLVFHVCFCGEQQDSILDIVIEIDVNTQFFNIDVRFF